MNQDPLKNELEKTLSYFEEMSLEYIYLDIDKAFLKDYPNFTIEDLENRLENLVKEKKIKIIKKGKQRSWIKLYPRKKSLFSRLISKVKSFFSR